MRAGEKTKKLFLWGACLLAGFIVFTLLLTVMDKRPVGPEGSYVGFATINDWFHRLTGVHRFWYTFTKILGYLAILTAAGFAALTGVQFVRRGMDLRKVDQKLLLLMALYAATFVCYVLFEIVVVNCRPVLNAEGKLDASYPSTHTLLALCVFGSLPPQLVRFLKGQRQILFGARIATYVLLGCTVLGRLICGWHWLTDVLGGILLSAALLCFYYGLLERIRANRKRRKRTGSAKRRSGEDADE